MAVGAVADESVHQTRGIGWLEGGVREKGLA